MVHVDEPNVQTPSSSWRLRDAARRITITEKVHVSAIPGRKMSVEESAEDN